MYKESAKRMMAGAVGEAAIRYYITLLQYQYPDKVITALAPLKEGNVYDLGFEIDHHFYHGQIKTTERCNPKGAMVFKTSRSTIDKNKNSRLELYKKEDIDFFFLYCIEEQWAGVALPEECRTTTKVYLTGQRPATSKMAYDLDFNKRMRELLEDGKISTLVCEQRRLREQNQDKNPLVPLIQEPESWSEFFNLYAHYGYNLQRMSDFTNVSVATLEKWRKKFCLS